jgi:glycosyltransferase involved in cell wall biosynthesis
MALVARGYAVHVTAPEPTASQQAAVAELGANLHPVPLRRTGLNPVADLRYLRSLRSLMRRLQPTFVLNYTAKPNIWGAIAAAGAGVPSASMVTGLGYAFIEGSSRRRRATQTLMRSLYRRATVLNCRVIFQNPDDRDDFIAAGCLADRQKAALVNGSGVDTNHFQPVPLPDAPVFLLIARLLWTKGIREYIEAALQVRNRMPHARFQLAGFLDEGPDAISRAELDTWIEAGIEYLGPLEDVRPAIAGASVYVLPSYREGTPRTVLEAMAMGRPIVTTDVPGCRETVRNKANGLLVPSQDVASLATAMTTLAEDSAARATMGTEARRMALEKYDAEAVATYTLAHLHLV